MANNCLRELSYSQITHTQSEVDTLQMSLRLPPIQSVNYCNVGTMVAGTNENDYNVKLKEISCNLHLENKILE
jgi:regulation of enolase protein 1 (concanavalin A-like superfamily)